MPVSAETLAKLMAAGVAGADLIAIVASIDADQSPPARSANAERQARWRAKQRNVTNNVTDGNADLPPKENPQTPKEITPNQTIPDPDGSAPLRGEIDSALEAYSAMAQRTGLAVPRVVNGARRQRVGALIKAHGMSVWLEAVGKVERSAFCRGDNERGWKADLDFITQAKSFAGLLEGRYDNRARGSPKPKAPSLAGAFGQFAELAEYRNDARRSEGFGGVQQALPDLSTIPDRRSRGNA